ncbi:MAG: NAD(P)H-dependent oxidoreductase [Desulfobacteraceae bacterium]|nr:NAD(P)H-dependent oxidoreductase [Desulfobacteraceae bacterium]
MKILVILGHPDQNSFNRAIARTAADTLSKNGHCVLFHDLYKEKFDPLLSSDEIPQNGIVPQEVETHCQELLSADGIIIVHPNWWGQPPAILKGWIDRVFRPGVAYEFLEGDEEDGIPVGLLKAKCAMIFNTSNTSEERENAVFGDPLDALWKKCIFDLCGVGIVFRRMFSVIVTSTPEQRKEWLKQVEESVSLHFPPKT